MAERKMHVHMDRAYRSTFMAWKTCRFPLKASAENLPDIFIHSLKTMCMLPRDSVLHIQRFERSSTVDRCGKFAFLLARENGLPFSSLRSLSFYPLALARLTITNYQLRQVSSIRHTMYLRSAERFFELFV